MEDYGLYLVIEKWLKDKNAGVTVTFNDINLLKANAVRVLITVSGPGARRVLGTGEYVNKRVRVQLTFQAGNDANSVMSMAELGSFMEESIPLKCNTSMLLNTNDAGFYGNAFVAKEEVPAGTVLTQARVNIIKTRNISGLIYIGKNEQGLARYTSNYELIYTITKEV